MSEAIHIGTNAQLLLDDRLIAESEGLTRVVHEPEMYEGNPIVTHDKPWEYDCILLWGTVLLDEEEGLYKMWYQTWGKLALPPISTLVCYATSVDGLRWEKPELGLHEFKGSKRNNIVLTPKADWLDAPTVIKDLTDPDPSRRYKMSLYECEGHPKLLTMSQSDPVTGIWNAVSPDGIHWTRLPGPVVKAGDRSGFYRDPLRGKWVVVTRMPDFPERTVGIAEGDEFGVYGPDASDLPERRS